MLGDNKAFAVWTLLLLAGTASLVAMLTLTGLTTLPDPLTFLQKVMMGLGVRASYKWFGGWDWAEWSIGNEASEGEHYANPGAPADAAAA